MADAMAAREARAAKREAAKVLAAHGVTGQVTVDVDQVSPAVPAPSPGSGHGPAESASRANLKSRVRRALLRMPKLGPRDAHPTMIDGWVPDYRDPDTGKLVRYDGRT